jgi:predicted enzyme related to lactoylglutathione lyase
LRTTNAEAAREFYGGLFGHDRAIVWTLHAQAVARGAMPHWLGSIGVEDVKQLERTAEALVQRGAVILAPTRTLGSGEYATVLRDPGGALVGLITPAASEPVSAVDVAWHVLNTNHGADALVNYRTLFGWRIADERQFGPSGAFHEFWWSCDEPESAGAIADIGDRSDIHPHWLFFFDVESLDAAVELTRRAGGSATPLMNGPRGERIVVCEDPQRAAFGLVERRERTSGTRH